MYTQINKCRICGNPELVSVLDLGEQALTGIFPKAKHDKVELMPLELVKCVDDGASAGASAGANAGANDGAAEHCGLLQLRHSGNLSELYGPNYGYRSGLNKSMVSHLHGKVAKILERVKARENDLIIDIGSNDSTLLQAYPKGNLELLGMDPTGVSFKQYYPAHIKLIPDFFSAQAIRAEYGSKKARIITSISMFYDLEEPLEFVKQIHDVLDDHGVWVFEQSYMPTMLKMLSYDTICHEHLEYYALKQIKWMTDRARLKIVDVEFNDINGGSFSIMCAKTGSPHEPNNELIASILKLEKESGLDTLKPYEDFKQKVHGHRSSLRACLQELKKEGKKVFGYGASTKGNVLLQFCGITQSDLPYIAEVNRDKFGSYTPGTLIPIISEEEAKAMKPDYFMVLPWHFRESILARERAFMNAGGTFLFPLPQIEVVK